MSRIFDKCFPVPASTEKPTTIEFKTAAFPVIGDFPKSAFGHGVTNDGPFFTGPIKWPNLREQLFPKEEK